MLATLRTVDDNATLIRRMAEVTTGADLGTAVERGRLSGEALRGAMLSCAICRHTQTCAAWLQRQSGRAEAPSFCRNEMLLRRLSAA